MLKTRLIPVLLLQNGQLVRSERFSTFQPIGNPINEVQRFNEWRVDELVYLSIDRGQGSFSARADHAVKTDGDQMAVLDAVSRSCFMPLTWGGGITSVDQMRQLFRLGADKVAVNTAAWDTPDLVTSGARAFGSQAIVVSIDVLPDGHGGYEVVVDGGRRRVGADPANWARQLEELGAGEILLQSIDRDGTGEGYDVQLISQVAKATRLPVIACSGVGRFEDYAAAIHAGASAAAAANIWHFRELSDRLGRRALERAGVAVRSHHSFDPKIAVRGS